MASNDAEVEVYLTEISRFPLLSSEEERALAFRIANGDEEARHDMIRSNLRLVVSIAKNYSDRGMSLLDLIEEGNLGLLKAVTRFNPDEGCKFSTYATWWIKQGIRRALINKVKAVRVPAYMFEEIARWKRTASLLAQELGRAASPEEIGKHLELTPQKISIIRKALGATAPIGRAGNRADGSVDFDEMLTSVPDREEEVPTEVEEWDREALRDAIDLGLSDRERQVIELRYGVNTAEEQAGALTLEEIGERIGLTRERVRQIESHALRKLQVFIQRKRVQEAMDRHMRGVVLEPLPDNGEIAPKAPVDGAGHSVRVKPSRRKRKKKSGRVSGSAGLLPAAGVAGFQPAKHNTSAESENVEA